MAQILIRRLDAALVRRLKRRARQQGRSLESEARAILEQAAQVDAAAARKLADRIRRSLRPRKFGDSTALVREDRDR
jgi:plasmid stability protein